MHSNRARMQQELLTEDSSSSEDTSITTLFINGLKYLRQTTLRFFKRRQVRQVMAISSAVSNASLAGPLAPESLGSTAYIVGGLAAMAAVFEALPKINREENDENEHTSARIVELDDNGQELPLRPQLTRRRRRMHSEVDGVFLTNLFNTEAAVDPLLTLRSLASFGSSGLRPSPVTLQRDRLGQLVRTGSLSLLGRFSDTLFLLASLDAPQEGNSLSQTIGTIALSMMLAELLITSDLMPVLRQRTVNGLRYLDATFPGQRSRPQPPNQQQFFAQNYYRPALPRPLPPLPRNEQRLNEVNFPSDLVPEEFTCALMSTVMDTPVRLPGTGQVCEALNILEAHAHKPENPFNRQPMDKEGPNGPQPELALRSKIGHYVDHVVEGVGNKKRELQGAALARSDYEAIHQAAMTRLEPQNQATLPSTPKMGR